MERRKVLATTGIALSIPFVGCLGGANEGDGESGEANGKFTHIVDVDADSSPGFPVEPGVSVVNQEATETRPASITVSWENVGDEPVRLGEASHVVFSAGRSDDESVHLLAFDQIGDREDAVSFDDCWHVTGEIVLDGAFSTADIEPGERHEAQPGLYANSSDCLTDGSYHFETGITVGDPEEPGGHGTTKDWGFILDIKTV